MIAMGSFILAGRRKLPPESPPSSTERYDPLRQLWVNAETGVPLVSLLRRAVSPSQYGETMMTETREGADQSEGAFQASPYGETSMTKTHEGSDQTEVTAMAPSPYGETSKTSTREGADQPERGMEASPYGETINTRTREGADQTEITSEASPTIRPSSSLQRPDVTIFDSQASIYAPDSHF
jgi:hypothetical protein